MRDRDFERYLSQDENITSKVKAVNTRVSKARSVEEKLSVNLDEIVRDDELTFRLLLRIKTELNDNNGSYQNAVRKYYTFINNKEFPTIAEYGKFGKRLKSTI